MVLFLLLQAAVAAGVLFLSDSYKPDAGVEIASGIPAGEVEETVSAAPATGVDVSVVEKSSGEEAGEPVPPPEAGTPIAAAPQFEPEQPDAPPAASEALSQAVPDDQSPTVADAASAPEAIAPPPAAAPENIPPADEQAAAEQLPATPEPEPATVEPAPATAAQEQTESAPVSTALTTIPEPIPSEPQPPPETFPRLPGEVFRDCAECPELVVIVAPSASESAAVGDGTAENAEPASLTDGPRPFAMGRFEVTFAEWDACVSDGGCADAPSDEGWGRNALPVINVSHVDIEQQYLPWLSHRAGARYRLPSAAEWERAAGNAEAASAGSVCETRNAAADGACDDGFEFTSPAGALKPNLAGLFDMHGNVWEWVADCWSPGFSDTAPKETESCEQRKLRGGSWSSTPTVMADGGRGWETATRKRNSIGFRVARDLP